MDGLVNTGCSRQAFYLSTYQLGANANWNLQGNDLCGYSAPSTPDLMQCVLHKFSINDSSFSEVVSGSITTGLKGKNAWFSAQ